MSREIALIYARAANGTIGRDGGLPWHIPADLKRFKALTLGGGGGGGAPMIMGRKTFESFARPLPGRRHIVLTRDRGWSAPGAEPVHGPAEALRTAGEGIVWVIGGAEVFAAFAEQADRIELTQIHAEVAGDVAMPAPGPEWREVAREDHHADAGCAAFSFVTYERRR